MWGRLFHNSVVVKTTQDRVKSFGRGQMSSLNSEGVQNGQHPNLFLRRGAGNKLSEALERQVRGNVYFSPASPRIITPDPKVRSAADRSLRLMEAAGAAECWECYGGRHRDGPASPITTRRWKRTWKWIFCIWQDPRLPWSCASPGPFQDCFQNPFLSCFYILAIL